MLLPQRFTTALALFFGTATIALAQPVLADGVVAVVGNEIILQSDVSIMKETLKREGQDRSECEVLNELILEKLLVHHAAIDSVVVDDAEIDDNISRRLEQLIAQIGSERRLTEYYKKSVVEIKEEMRPLMRNQLTAQRMQSTITENVKVTPVEVENVIKGLPLDSLPLIGTEVELAQIIINPKVSAKSEQEAIERLDQLRTRILNGSSFATMAILYSEDPGSNRNGGEYKGIKRGQFVTEFDAVSYNLEVGEISKPFKTEFGYHIVQLQAKRGEELDLRHILVKPKLEQKDLDIAQGRLDSIRTAIKAGTLSFESAAERFSEDEETKLNGGIMLNPNTMDVTFNLDQLDRGIFYAIQNLEVDELSEASLVRDPQGKEYFRLIHLRNKIDPHRANLKQDLALLKQYVENQRRQQTMDAWVARKKAETALKVNGSYVDCAGI
ncbi:MAG: peptidylprolyl isomerase [Schleiferiaceae bacterium]|nr:peptidylprolyl isomerase [Schleiferiaceae bacterium]